MIDRDEFIRARIDNRLDDRYVLPKKVRTGMGTMAVRQFSQNGITIGSFAKTKRLFMQNEPDYFIESPLVDSPLKRQLWFPSERWTKVNGLSIAVQRREILETTEDPDRRFAAWQDIQPQIDDLEDYSPFDTTGQALYEQALLLLQFVDANDTNLSIEII